MEKLRPTRMRCYNLNILFNPNPKSPWKIIGDSHLSTLPKNGHCPWPNHFFWNISMDEFGEHYCHGMKSENIIATGRHAMGNSDIIATGCRQRGHNRTNLDIIATGCNRRGRPGRTTTTTTTPPHRTWLMDLHARGGFTTPPPAGPGRHFLPTHDAMGHVVSLEICYGL